jgi:hypothetical protein
MGGLISRKALILDNPNHIDENTTIKLATVSTPFSGIKAAKNCANPYFRVATLGIHDMICWLASGNKWYEITPPSDFIKRPGKLSPIVSKHIVIVTDESNSCRYYNQNQECLEDDFVFSLNEQKLVSEIDSNRQENFIIKAGHVGIVGKFDHSPNKLINLLQREGFIKHTEASREFEFNLLVATLFGK